jgi:hypothetical protein
VRGEVSDIAAAVSADAASAQGAASTATAEADRAAAQIRMFQVVDALPDQMVDGVIYAVRRES